MKERDGGILEVGASACSTARRKRSVSPSTPGHLHCLCPRSVANGAASSLRISVDCRPSLDSDLVLFSHRFTTCIACARRLAGCHGALSPDPGTWRQQHGLHAPNPMIALVLSYQWPGR